METKNISHKSEEIEKLLKKGYEEIEAKRWDYAIIVFEKILSMDENSDDAIRGILEAHRAHANDELKNQNWESALKISNTMLSLNYKISFPYLIRLLAKTEKESIDDSILFDMFFSSKKPELCHYPEHIKDYGNFLKYLDKEAFDDFSSDATEAVYCQICSLLDSGNIHEASNIFPFIEGHRDINEKFKNTKYILACEALYKKHFDEAKKLFSEISEYKDSAEKFKQTSYALACQYADEDLYGMAKLEFEDLGNYKDASTRAYLCESYSNLKNEAQLNRRQYQKEIEALTSELSSTKSKFTSGKFTIIIRFLSILFTIAPFILYFTVFPIDSITIAGGVSFTILFIFATIDFFQRKDNFVKKILKFAFKEECIIGILGLACSVIGLIVAVPLIAAYIIGIPALFVIYFIYASFIFIIDFFKLLINDSESKSKHNFATREQAELENKLKFHLETMLGDEIETFESEAESIGFMVGYGKALIEKYSKI